MKVCKLLLLSAILSGSTLPLAAQTGAQPKGKYIPTRWDSVKKVVPPQVYGNPRAARNADSLLKARQAAEAAEAAEAERRLQEEKARMAREAAEAEKRLAEEKARQAAEQQPGEEPKKPEPKKSKPEKKSMPVVVQPAPEKPLLPLKPRYGKGSWPLNECVEYARVNNLQIRESELNERMARLIMEQNRASRLPSLNGDMNVGESYGRSIDPTSNQFVTQGFTYNTMGLSTQTLLFGWFQKKHQIRQSKYEADAASFAYNQLKDDVSLNVATGFLRVLLAREQVKISEAQLKLDNEQYQQTLQLVESGRLPELNAAQMLAQLSSDSASLVNTRADERIALLQLRALMNFSFDETFDISAPDLNMVQLANLGELPPPEYIFRTAADHQNRMKYNQMKLLSAKKTLDAAKAIQYPTLSLFANLGTNFSSNVKDITGQNYLGEVPLGNINIGGTSYPITRPDYSYTTRTRGVFTQYGNNIRLNAGLALSVPMFNAYSARTNIQKAKIGLVSQQIAMDNDMQRLKQDVFTAYEQARAASQKYSSARRSQDAAMRALEFAVKRYQAGMISTFEYTSSLNTLYTASTNTLSAKYDLIFKLKVLDYYLGNPLKL